MPQNAIILLQQKHNAFRKLLNAQQYLKSNHGDLLLGHADIIGSCVYSYIMISEASLKNCSRKPVNRCQNLTTELSQDTYLNTTFKNVFSKLKNKNPKINLRYFLSLKGFCGMVDSSTSYFQLLWIWSSNGHWPKKTCTTEIMSMSVRKNTLCYDLF